MDTPQLLFNGLAVGSIIALAAVGLTLTCGILRLSNFAHGDFMTLGAYITWLVNAQGVNLWLAMPVGAAVTAIAMLIAERLLWKPMRDRRADSTTLIIISIGLALFLRNGILMIWGGSNQRYDLPVMTATEIFGIKVAFDRLLVIGLAIIVIIALHFLLQKTKIGKAMRAVADSNDLARVTGINVEWVVFWTWIITGVLTALAGGMFGLITGGVRPNMGWFLILPMFAAVILGGIGNPYGAIAGALIIGVAQEISVPLIGSDYKLAVALLIMILLLLFRPQGLFKGTV
ncbi:branched-chain amino acid ABC transporter permease [Microcystis aeruginosa LEGE 11464]|jgi:neutral amino acid transport system permease protein|uniref:Genome sequencing data, contig C326 n=1 Tax=Microcystis aeruginosa PCC 9443 TaxID=1160281 RepID=I4G2L4_MICAE|nr:branched-chain amino acid ABC transporter permease [Microcystis aeruginosa]MBE9089913.1 branched-chain amino acid ABC transporter permease [Microcystis aeruginosa LEGE 11464]MCZ8127645.1 branched-chain amino acid ABC transporter permease [Microcystis sp. LE19-114.1B]GBE74954.1 amino acid transport system permease protein [Microcystis aeruginosa NIES-87]CCI02175.1 Genome sequencing data, contig C326 [Microcystis aeruginosa PCC 9443]